MALYQDNNEDMMQCPICLEQYEIPRALPCLHTFCEKCLIDWVKHKSVTSTLTIGSQRSFPCPVCKDDANVPPEGIKGFRHNFYVASMVNPGSPTARKLSAVEDVLQIDLSKICNRCEEKGVVKICIKCNVWLCSLCCDDHKRVKGTKSHILVSANDLSEVKLPEEMTNEDLSVCIVADHEKPNGLFCLQCKVLLCELCQSIGHPLHDMVNIVSKLDDLRDNLLDSLGMIQKRDELLKKQYSVISHARKDLVSRGHKVIHNFDKGVAEIEKKMQDLKAKMHKDMKKHIAGQLKLLDERMIGLNDKIMIGESVQEEMRFILESGSNKDILTQSNQLSEQAERWLTSQGSQLDNVITVTLPCWKQCEDDIFNQLLVKLLGNFESSPIEININRPSKSKRSKRTQSDPQTIRLGSSSSGSSTQSGNAEVPVKNLVDIIRDFDPLGGDANSSNSNQTAELLVDTNVPETIPQHRSPISIPAAADIVVQESHDTESSPASDADSETNAENCPDYVNLNPPPPPPTSGPPPPPSGPFYSENQEVSVEDAQYWWPPPPHPGVGGFRHPPPHHHHPPHGHPHPHWMGPPLHHRLPRHPPPPPPGILGRFGPHGHGQREKHGKRHGKRSHHQNQ